MYGLAEASGAGPDSHWSRGLFGCEFSLVLSTGILEASGLVADAAVSWWVCSWFAGSSNGMVLAGSHVLVVVEPRALGLWAFSSRFCLLGFGVSFSLCLARQRVGSISRCLCSVPIPFYRSDAGVRWSLFGCVEVYVY